MSHRVTLPVVCVRHKQVMTEDVYYMHLLFKDWGNRSLTLLHLTLSEFVVERKERALLPADIFHKLKKPGRFDFLHERPHLLSQKPLPTKPPQCELLRTRYRRVAQVRHCCAQWVFCDYFRSM
mmetsp:Transcript_3314/g.8246  ORF Transcript_3314/g.8246 Transcript_3314/m.8246 type:complete len:123 (-) Transcript_3314:43-411(-)